MNALRRKSRRGFTMVEVLIASGILAIVFLGAMTGVLFVSRMSTAAQQDLMAMEVLDRETELIRAAPIYAALGDTTQAGPHNVNPIYEDQSFTRPRNFRGTGAVPANTLRAVRYDPTFPDSGPTFDIEYTWYGFGVATGGDLTALRFDQSEWPDGVDFEGSFVVLRDGVGAGQMARITEHIDGEFTLDAAFNGYTESNLLVAPTAGTRFEVDGGKWVRVTARWNPTPNDDERVVERILFVANR